MDEAISLGERIGVVTDRIRSACRRAGRPVDSVRLVAVTKRVSADRIREAVTAGITDFGESYIQEALPKMLALADRVPPRRWHFIGRAQRNKAKLAVGRFGLIHSVDSLELAAALERQAAMEGVRQSFLVQVNVANEPSKGGIRSEAVLPFVESLLKFEHLEFGGLMTIPPLESNPEASRAHFHALTGIAHRLAKAGTPCRELSMGMSNDFEEAILEGATLVRVGTALFGPREA